MDRRNGLEEGANSRARICLDIGSLERESAVDDFFKMKLFILKINI